MIRIGDLTLSDDAVAVHERRDTDPDVPARTIRITGSVGDAGTLGELESRLDDIVRAAFGGDTGDVQLSLRPGRCLSARLQRFDREVHRTGREAVFTAWFTPSQAFEEAESESQESWTIRAWGAALPVENDGTTSAPLQVQFTAEGPITTPAFDDGVRRLSYSGVMAAGQVLVVDGAARRATLNGADVTALMAGDYPQLEPGAATLHFYDDFDSSHQGAATVRWHARWW